MKKLKKIATTRALALGLMIVATSAAASAGTDTTFDSMTNAVDGWLGGSLGKLIALGGVLVSVGSAFRSNWGGVIGGVVVAMIAAFGPAVAQGMFTGVI